MKHPAFVQQLAIPPKTKLNCREGDVSIHTPGLATTDLGQSFLSVFAPVLSRSLPTYLKTPARFDRLVGQVVGHPGKMR
jgi:hypothetical protein